MPTERDYYQSELMTALAGITVNSNSLTVSKDGGLSNSKVNVINVYIGDEETNWRTEKTTVESGTKVNFEILTKVGVGGGQDTIDVKNEAINKVRKALMDYRKSTPKRTTTDDFRVEIVNLEYTGVFTAEDTKYSNVQILMTGNLITNLWEL